MVAFRPWRSGYPLTVGLSVRARVNGDSGIGGGLLGHRLLAGIVTESGDSTRRLGLLGKTSIIANYSDGVLLIVWR